MHKVLLVDDEALIREAISENIAWEEMGFSFMGACENGKQAIERIEEAQPDLLLTDINMPFVDGMELTKYVYENYPQIKVIIISGYDEFEYAKNAVKYQVLEYILKPITPAEFSETLLRAKKILDEKRESQRDIKKIRSAYVKNLPTLQGKYLQRLLNGTADYSKMSKKLEELKISLEGNVYNTALVEADSLEPFTSQYENVKDELALFAIYNITAEIVTEENCGIAFQSMDEKTVIIFMGMEQSALRIKMDRVIPRIRTAIEEFLQLHVTIAEGEMVSGPEELADSYAKTKNEPEQKAPLGSNQMQAMRALEYIEKNYGDSSVTLNSVCSELAMSVSYFSSVFKNYTGETFIESLTKKRIEKAKILLEQGSLRNYEIAEAVGFSDPHYFGITFKKITGMTPKEYGKEVRK